MRKRKHSGMPPKRVWFKGQRLTFSQIGAIVGVTRGAVRKYYARHKSLEGLGESVNGKRMGYCRKSGGGMNIDTLFLQGRIDPDTYARYLREFGEQQRHGKGHKAYATLVDGVIYYEMSAKEDYFYGGMPFEDCCLHHPFEEVCGLAASMLPLPDLTKAVVRETEGGRLERWIPHNGWDTADGERWMPSGSMTMPPPDSPFDESLDDYLKRVEECPQDTL